MTTMDRPQRTKTPRKLPPEIESGHEITLDGKRVTVSQVIEHPRLDGHYEISGSYQQHGKLRRTGITRAVRADKKITVHNWVDSTE